MVCVSTKNSKQQYPAAGRHDNNMDDDYSVDLIFTARCYASASAVLAMGLCLCLFVSVCLSVCLTQVGVLLKRPNVGSHKQHDTIVQGL